MPCYEVWTRVHTLRYNSAKTFSTDIFQTVGDVALAFGSCFLFEDPKYSIPIAFQDIWSKGEHQKIKWTPEIMTFSRKSRPNPFMTRTFQIQLTSCSGWGYCSAAGLQLQGAAFGTEICLKWSGKTCNKIQ